MTRTKFYIIIFKKFDERVNYFKYYKILFIYFIY